MFIVDDRKDLFRGIDLKRGRLFNKAHFKECTFAQLLSILKRGAKSSVLNTVVKTKVCSMLSRHAHSRFPYMSCLFVQRAMCATRVGKC